MEYSSRSPVRMIRVPVAPSSSSSAADLPGQHWQVAAVDPHRAQVAARHLDRRPHRPGHVVGVHQQRRGLAEGLELGLEGVPLAVVHQGEGVRAGARARDPVLVPRPQVRRGREAGDVGRPGAGHRGPLVGPSRAHLDQRAVAGRGHHPGRGGGDRAVVVEDGQDDGFQQHRLGERALHDEDRRTGEVAISLGVTPDVSAETVGFEESQRRLVHDARAAEEFQVGRAEAEPLYRVEQPSGACHDAVPAAMRQVPGENLEDGPAVGRAAAQRRLQHGELVVVGQQCCPTLGRPKPGCPGRVSAERGLVVHGIRHRWKTTEWEVGSFEHGAR